MISAKQFAIYSLVASCFSIVGYDPACMNGILSSSDFKQRYGVSDDGGQTMDLASTTKSLFASLMVIGALIGCCIPALAVHKVGRKGLFKLAGFAHALGVCVLLTAPTPVIFIVGRAIIGVALGLITAITGAYFNEACAPGSRGSIFGILQLLLALGAVLSSGINWATRSLPGTNSWKITVGFQLLISVVMIATSLVVPESPSILVHWGRLDDAAKSLAITRNLEESCNEIQTTILRLTTDNIAYFEKEASDDLDARLSPATIFLSCFHGTALRRTFLVAVASAMSLMTGFVFFTTYGTTILTNAGVSNAHLVSFVLALVQFGSTIPAIILTDVLGRRALLLAGTSVMALVLLLGGLLYTVFPGSEFDPQMLIAGVVVYVVCYGVSWGPCSWLMLAEPLSSSQRLPQTSISFVVYWLVYLLIDMVTPFWMDREGVNMGSYLCYLWFGGVVAALVWVYMCVPELRGLSEDQIDMLFEQKVPAWRSKQWRRELPKIDEEQPKSIHVVNEKGSEVTLVGDVDMDKKDKAAEVNTVVESKPVIVKEVVEVEKTKDNKRQITTTVVEVDSESEFEPEEDDGEFEREAEEAELRRQEKLKKLKAINQGGYY